MGGQGPKGEQFAELPGAKEVIEWDSPSNDAAPIHPHIKLSK
jgi:hypothetical protein